MSDFMFETSIVDSAEMITDWQAAGHQEFTSEAIRVYPEFTAELVRL